MRRLLAQFGVAALAVAMTAGFALADTNAGAVPGNASASNDQSTVVSSGGDSTVSTSTSTNQSAGPGSGIASPPGGQGGGPTAGSDSGTGSNLTPPPTDGTPPAAPNQQSLNLPGAGSADNQPTGPSAAALPNQPTQTSPVSADQAGQPTTPEIRVAVHQAAAVVAASQVKPVVLATSTPALPQSNTPQAPVGFLSQLHFLLAQVVVPPAAHAFPDLPPLVAAAIAAAIILMLTLPSRAIGSLSSYTARLRRSGFLGAARSDVGGAHLLFATPREMSFIGAYA